MTNEIIASSKIPEGSEFILYRHEKEYIIRVNGHILMSSGNSNSEKILAELACSYMKDAVSPCVLVGGMGMGYTLRATLDLLTEESRVWAIEIVPAIIEWNKGILGSLNGFPLHDPRVCVLKSDIWDIIENPPVLFDAILLDVDNGPSAPALKQNRRLYTSKGLTLIKQALKDNGIFAIWSADPDTGFSQRLHKNGFSFRTCNLPIQKGNRENYIIYLAQISH
jgi:spermidine synthase